MKEVILNVDKMVCEGCENRVKNSVSKINGVEKVEASFKEKIVKVVMKEDVNVEDIKARIEDIGFEVLGEK